MNELKQFLEKYKITLLVSTAIFILVIILSYLIYWLAGNNFERDADLAYTTTLGLIVGLILACFVGATYQDYKKRD